jgi:hypothetical protein
MPNFTLISSRLYYYLPLGIIEENQSGTFDLPLKKGDTVDFDMTGQFDVENVVVDGTSFFLGKSYVGQTVNLNAQPQYTVPNFSVNYQFVSSYSSFFSTSLQGNVFFLTANASASEMGVSDGTVVGNIIATISYGGVTKTIQMGIKAKASTTSVIQKQVTPATGTITSIQYKKDASSSWQNWNTSQINVDPNEAQSYRAYFTLNPTFQNGSGQIKIYEGSTLRKTQTVNISSGGAWVNLNNFNPSYNYTKVEFKLNDGRPAFGL